jgi:hypothetical protein
MKEGDSTTEKWTFGMRGQMIPITAGVDKFCETETTTVFLLFLDIVLGGA